MRQVRRAGGLRLLTAATVLGLCGTAAWRAGTLIAVAESRDPGGDRPATIDRFRGWLGLPGVGDAVLDAPLRAAPPTGAPAGVSDAARTRAAQLSALLSVRPLSAKAWLSLAGMRLVEGAPYPTVLAALKMSWLTGPNEGALLWQRGLFGLLQWQWLPRAARRRTARDLAGAMLAGLVETRDLRIAKAVLATKSARTQASIAGLLRQNAIHPSALAALGLSAASQETK